MLPLLLALHLFQCLLFGQSECLIELWRLQGLKLCVITYGNAEHTMKMVTKCTFHGMWTDFKVTHLNFIITYQEFCLHACLLH